MSEVDAGAQKSRGHISGPGSLLAIDGGLAQEAKLVQ